MWKMSLRSQICFLDHPFIDMALRESEDNMPTFETDQDQGASGYWIYASEEVRNDCCPYTHGNRKYAIPDMHLSNMPLICT